MKRWLSGKRGVLVAFVALTALVAGGLGWATRAALRLERHQLDQQSAVEHADRLRLALWRLDSRMNTVLAREDARPFSHYSAVFAPPLALDGTGLPVPPGAMLELSPLLSAELPDWMLLHFQTDESGWESPQVLSTTLRGRLRGQARGLTNVTGPRKELLDDLCRDLPPERLLARTRRNAGQMTILDRAVLARLQLNEQNDDSPTQQAMAQSQREWAYRSGRSSKLTQPQSQEARIAKNVAILNFWRNGEDWLDDTPLFSDSRTKNNPDIQTNTFSRQPPLPRLPSSAEVAVRMSSMVGLWLPTDSGRDRLVVVRLVRVEEKDICQGIVLDADSLMALLAEEVHDLFPEARVQPASMTTPELLDRTMTTLPLQLDPGPVAPATMPGWTPVRVGLGLAWAAVFIATVAVGLGGWSISGLSQRRARFISAVTHELRTPLTTLRLYLDLMLGGMVRDEQTKREYLETMQSETDRLTRLVGNVLDFSRLESQSPKLTRGPVSVADILTRTAEPWVSRCVRGGKELIVEDAAGAGCCVETDAELLQQVLANLLDNACKYSHDAADKRLWLRARREGSRVVFEVEDRGPGVAAGEKSSIFRPFRRGKSTDATTGGVGLGLALARWWSEILGGRLTLTTPAEGGACFGVELPVCEPRAE